MGFTLKSSKNIANVFHLWHKEGTGNEDFNPKEDLALFNKNKKDKKYICNNGLNKYLKENND